LEPSAFPSTIKSLIQGRFRSGFDLPARMAAIRRGRAQPAELGADPDSILTNLLN
jgi:hypothetical protein